MANKIELNWLGKNEQAKLEPRILLEDSKLSYSKKSDKSENTSFENVLIHGDNLLGLKALEHSYAGKIKCIYIDPPYNTGAAFEHYDDNKEHSIWLSLMRDRLELLKNLLSDDGTIWISIDSDESHYLKVLCDEIFGRRNFIDEIVWQRAFAPINLKKTLSRSHDDILVYAKNYSLKFELNKLPRTAANNARYKNPDNDPRGPWTSGDFSVGPRVESNVYEITTPSGRKILPPEGRSWVMTEERFKEMVADNRIWFGAKGNNAPRSKRFLSDVRDGVVSVTWWTRDEVGDNQEAKREIKALKFEGSPFDTPKPERLIHRIITLATNPGDIVLDSFLGSGTTIAVAHKMHRRWIGIEMEDTAYSYCKKRIDLVIDGRDKGGITESVNWSDGGGYKFYELAPSLINIDPLGEPIINKKYNAEMLAAAVALHENFTYSPDPNCFWKQSKSTEHSFLYVTTKHVSLGILTNINNEMKEEEFLIIACKSYDADLEKRYKNIVIKKIPEMLLSKCEFDKDNYKLNIVNPPMYEDDKDGE